MKTIRASEISTYIYCQRAWWYQKNGHPNQNQSLLADGQKIHQRHGKAVFTAGCLSALAYLSLLLAVVILAVYFTMQLV
jgi:hypothetical protein